MEVALDDCAVHSIPVIVETRVRQFEESRARATSPMALVMQGVSAVEIQEETLEGFSWVAAWGEYYFADG